MKGGDYQVGGAMVGPSLVDENVDAQHYVRILHVTHEDNDVVNILIKIGIRLDGVW